MQDTDVVLAFWDSHSSQGNRQDGPSTQEVASGSRVQGQLQSETLSQKKKKKRKSLFCELILSARKNSKGKKRKVQLKRGRGRGICK
jgi:hypothetical protein